MEDVLNKTIINSTRSIKEHEVLRFSATIGDAPNETTVDIARKEVLRWTERRCGGELPVSAWNFESFEYFTGGRTSVGVRIEGESSDIWGIRADDPDKNIAGRTWTTEAIVGAKNGEVAKLSLRLLVSTAEPDLNITAHTPGLAQQISDKCGLFIDRWRMSPKPWVIDSESSLNNLVEMLFDENRTFPVFVLSVPDVTSDANRTIINSEALAKATLGIGRAAILHSNYTWKLTNIVGKSRSVFGGAVRVYMPKFSINSDPFDHKLFLAEHLRTEDGITDCSKWLRNFAATESLKKKGLGNDPLKFSTLRDASLKTKQERLALDGAADSAQLSAANERIAALEKNIDEEIATQEYFAKEHAAAEARAEDAERLLIASNQRIQFLVEKLQEKGAAQEDETELPSDWSELNDWVDANLTGRLVLSPSARRGIRSPKFRDASQAARCLLWLASHCRDSHINGGDGSLREHPIEDGIRNAHCGGDRYETKWQGRTCTVNWHVKNGGDTRDPERCLRIYYFWDPATSQVVVSDMPAHRRTGAT
ncbi:hypothetical protein [Thalassospira alkalitolerans]|uniref:hypothetical protein n=1 Tax=Thalassospira alkalitolerans TaxID=1293890 RepID=UPI00111BD185|nr:hypothetical protein [Thalassospira alkalitolerans]